MSLVDEKDITLFHTIIRQRRGAALLLLLFILVSFTSLHAGGSRTRNELDEIQFWHSMGTYNKEVLNGLVAGYNETHKGHAVEALFQGNDRDLYLKLLSPENQPDCALIPNSYVWELRKQAIIIDLLPFITEDLKEDMEPRYWEALTVDGGIYGLPFSLHSNILFVNQHILRISGTRRDMEPGTWDEIFPILRKIRDYTDDNWPIFIPMENLHQFIAFVESYSGQPVLRGNNLIVNSPESIEAMRALQDFVYDQEFMPPKLTSTEAEQIFLSGNLGIMMSSSSRLVFTQTHLPYNLTVWNLPYNKNTRHRVSGASLAITSTGLQRGHEIFRFLEYLVNFESSVKWHTRTGAPPIRNSAKESLDLLIFYEENPNYMTPIIDLERGVLLSPRFNFYAMDSLMRSALEEILIKGVDPEKILNHVQQELNLLQIL
jgi:ABC-type glycerol-3-phosphate transport system substrate-binding protein